MRSNLAIVALSQLILFISCNSGNKTNQPTNFVEGDSLTITSIQKADSVGITRVDAKDSKQSIQKIVKKYGVQWDFCDCVQKGDSINKALKVNNLSENTLNKLLQRFDEIDRKCQAFKITDPSRTPEDRALHEKKVADCLNNNK